MQGFPAPDLHANLAAHNDEGALLDVRHDG
jgi:hypothetical protein